MTHYKPEEYTPEIKRQKMIGQELKGEELEKARRELFPEEYEARYGKEEINYPRVGTACLVVNNKGNVLMARRVNGENPGEWCPPGGKLDFGEFIKAGLEREVKEETGLTLKVHMLPLVTQNLTSNDHHYVCFWGFAFLNTDQDTLDFVEYKHGKPKISGNWQFLDPNRALEQHKKERFLFGKVPDALLYYLHYKDRLLQKTLDFDCWA
jgi:ADP-ribose pyrophosphatase YjhB (NUDIX family)